MFDYNNLENSDDFNYIKHNILKCIKIYSQN